MFNIFFKQRKNQRRDIHKASKKLSKGLCYIEKRDKLFKELDVYGTCPIKKYVASKGLIATTICLVAKVVAFIFLGFAAIIGLTCLVTIGDKVVLNILLIIEIINITILLFSLMLIMLFSKRKDDITMYESLVVRKARNRIRKYSFVINEKLSEVPPLFRNKKAIVAMINLMNKGAVSNLCEAVNLYEVHYCKNRSYKQLKKIEHQFRSETIGGN